MSSKAEDPDSLCCTAVVREGRRTPPTCKLLGCFTENIAQVYRLMDGGALRWTAPFETSGYRRRVLPNLGDRRRGPGNCCAFPSPPHSPPSPLLPSLSPPPRPRYRSRVPSWNGSTYSALRRAHVNPENGKMVHAPHGKQTSAPCLRHSASLFAAFHSHPCPHPRHTTHPGTLLTHRT